MKKLRILECGLRMAIGVFFYSLFTIHYSLAQQPRGQFLQDSIKLGKPFQYALSFRHKPDLDVLFPDTTYNFKPFEVKSFEYFPTKTDTRGSLDSVVYTLVSFDIHKIQPLSLPIFINMPTDCTTVYANKDSVILMEMFDKNTQKAILKTDDKIFYLPQEPNYPLILLGFVGFWLLFGLVYWLLGETIRKRWQQYRLWRRYSDFLSAFQKFERNVSRRQKTVDNAENALLLWRRFLEKLENKPFTTFTTTELVDALQDDRLAEALRSIDATVYGGNIAKDISDALQILKELATQMYKKRL